MWLVRSAAAATKRNIAANLLARAEQTGIQHGAHWHRTKNGDQTTTITYYHCYDRQHDDDCDNHTILTATTTRLQLPPSTTTPYYYYDYHSHFY